MKKLYVYTDFDWLKEIELVGELGYESLRGSDSYSFSFHDEWLREHGDLFLSEDLNNYPGMCNIRSREKTYSDVFRMPCQTVRAYFAFATGADSRVGRRQAGTSVVIV